MKNVGGLELSAPLCKTGVDDLNLESIRFDERKKERKDRGPGLETRTDGLLCVFHFAFRHSMIGRSVVSLRRKTKNIRQPLPARFVPARNENMNASSDTPPFEKTARPIPPGFQPDSVGPSVARAEGLGDRYAAKVVKSWIFVCVLFCFVGT